MAQHLHADLLVHAHLRELVGRQPARLVQQLVRHDELADVVHQRREPQPLEPGGHEVELFADVARVVGDALRVPRRVTVLRLERVDQHPDGLVVRFLHAHVRREHLAGDEDRHDDQQHHRRRRARGRGGRGGSRAPRTGRPRLERRSEPGQHVARRRRPRLHDVREHEQRPETTTHDDRDRGIAHDEQRRGSAPSSRSYGSVRVGQRPPRQHREPEVAGVERDPAPRAPGEAREGRSRSARPDEDARRAASGRASKTTIAAISTMNAGRDEHAASGNAPRAVGAEARRASRDTSSDADAGGSPPGSRRTTIDRQRPRRATARVPARVASGTVRRRSSLVLDLGTNEDRRREAARPRAGIGLAPTTQRHRQAATATSPPATAATRTAIFFTGNSPLRQDLRHGRYRRRGTSAPLRNIHVVVK